jgi:hypothetical protein
MPPHENLGLSNRALAGLQTATKCYVPGAMVTFGSLR